MVGVCIPASLARSEKEGGFVVEGSFSDSSDVVLVEREYLECLEWLARMVKSQSHVNTFRDGAAVRVPSLAPG